MHGVLITAYKNFDSLIYLIESFNDQFELYIHIDKKSVLSRYDDEKIQSFNRVKYISREYNVNWGSFAHLEACLLLANRALESDAISRIHFITGEDFCLVPPDKIIEQFYNDDLNYIKYEQLPKKQWKSGGLSRLEYFNFHEFIQARKYRGWIHVVPSLQKIFKHKRRIPSALLPLYGGCGYWSLTRAALQYVVDFTNEHTSLYKRFKYTFCAEEIYFQTILLNSHMDKTVVNDYLRHIDWGENDGSQGPPYLDISCFDQIVGTNKIFGRKYKHEKTAELQKALWDRLS